MRKRKAMQAQDPTPAPAQEPEAVQSQQASEAAQASEPVARVRLDPAQLYDWQLDTVVPYDGYALTVEWQEIPLRIVREWQSRIGKGHAVPPIEVDVPDGV